MTDPARRVYSPERLRLVLILLTVVTLPFVIGASILIYTYVRFGVMVDRRLQGERWMTPSRIYARPLTLREGLPLGSRDLVKVLNGLKYEQKSGGPPAPGTFAIGERDVTFAPRPIPGAAPEPLRVIFDKEKVKEIRGLESRKHYPEETLEPELITYLFDSTRSCRNTWSRPCSPSRTGASSATPASTRSASRLPPSATSRPTPTSRAGAPSPSSSARTSS